MLSDEAFLDYHTLKGPWEQFCLDESGSALVVPQFNDAFNHVACFFVA